MTLESIKQAIGELSEEERHTLAAWLNDASMDDWDREMRADFSSSGRGAHLGPEIEAEIDAGRFRPMPRRG